MMPKPLFGTSFTVGMETTWFLDEGASKNVVMREPIKSSYTATMSDTFVGVVRLRLALGVCCTLKYSGRVNRYF